MPEFGRSVVDVNIEARSMSVVEGEETSEVEEDAGSVNVKL